MSVDTQNERDEIARYLRRWSLRSRRASKDPRNLAGVREFYQIQAGTLLEAARRVEREAYSDEAHEIFKGSKKRDPL